MDLFVPKRAAAAVLALSLICLAALAPSAAEATVPGKPGLIAFNLLTFPGGGEPTGGLYAIEPGQPQPRQLTDNPRDYDPSFAPSGKQLVFRRIGTSQPGIYTLDLGSDTTTRLLSRGDDLDPAFGPRGMIAFLGFSRQTGSYDLFLRLRNGRLRQLTSTSATEGAPVFTPDGGRILFSRRYGHVVALDRRTSSLPALYSIRIDGTGLRLIGTARKENFDLSPTGDHLAFAGVGGISYSPDGRQIAYANHKGLWVRRADGQGQPALVLAADYNGYEAGQLLIQPTWQPLP